MMVSSLMKPQCQLLRCATRSLHRSLSINRSCRWETRNAAVISRGFSNTSSHFYESTVNAAEISHFDALASSWWDPHGPSRLLHKMNPERHSFIASCVDSFPDHGNDASRTYLDIGCGGGIFAESAARLPTTKGVVAIDPSQEVISVAKRHARRDPVLMAQGRLDYKVSDVEHLSQQQGMHQAFDVVSLFEVIEHVDVPAPFLETCMQFVKPGGWLILSTISRTWMSWFTTKFIAEDVTGIVPQGTHQWAKFINADELLSWYDQKPGWGTGGGKRIMGVAYIPGLDWVRVPQGERLGNYFFGIRRDSP